jgi:hypothetical protein
MAPHAQKPRRNPFRSEQDAFRVLLYILAAALIIFLAATLISTWLGVVLAIIAVALGTIQTTIWLRDMINAPSDDR